MLIPYIALLGSLAVEAHATSSFEKYHQRRSHTHHYRPRAGEAANLFPTLPSTNETQEIDLTKRSSQCAFPYGSLMTAVTPDASNAGWAMSPDQSCTPGTYCPYACSPGYVMDQWDPAATTYSYPESMYGGLYCNDDGTMSKPFPGRDYCKPGVGTVYARNAMSSSVAFCQTVLPGNEAMLIPTSVYSGSVTGLAVPDTTYWASTAAHYYINPAGVSASEGCVWGSNANPWGNWAPYVAGANMDGSGNTFLKIGWNPIYTDDPSWSSVAPSWAVSIECTGGNCNGIPCRCDPSLDGINKCSGGSSGAGDAAFCVVTIPEGGSANVVVYDVEAGAGSASSNKIKAQVNAAVASSSSSSAAATPTTTTSTTPTSTSTSTTPTTTSTTSTSTTSSSTTTTTTSSTTTSSTPTSTSTSTSSSTSWLKTSSVAWSSSSSSSSVFSYPTLTTTSSFSALNLSTSSSSHASMSTFQPMYLNASTPTMIVAANPVTTTLLHGGAGYDNLAATAAATPTHKSGAQAMLQVSPILAFAAAVVILLRL